MIIKLNSVPGDFIPQGSFVISLFEFRVQARSDLKESEGLLSGPSSSGGVSTDATCTLGIKGRWSG